MEKLRVTKRKGETIEADPDAGGIGKETLGRLEEKKSKHAHSPMITHCPNLFAANFKTTRGVAANGRESSSQSQEEAKTAKKQERNKMPVVERNQKEKVKKSLFAEQHSVQNARVQQEMQQKQELGEHQQEQSKSKPENKTSLPLLCTNHRGLPG